MSDRLILVVTDLDGTLWDNTLACHPETRAAVVELQARNDVAVIAATGRRPNSARRAFAHNAIAMPAVLLNGAIGFDFIIEEQFHSIAFANDDLRHVLRVLGGHGVAPVAYLADHRAVAVEGVTTSVRHLETLEGDLVWWSVEELAERDDVLGLSMLGIEIAAVEAAMQDLIDHPASQTTGFSDHLYPPFSLMIAPPAITKQRGIDAYRAARGIEPSVVVAVGDAGNDVPMLEAADVAVVVAGAVEAVRAHADHEIAGPAEGGWAALVELIDQL